MSHEMPRTAEVWQVSIGNNGQVIPCAADETILHAAILAGIDYPYACASGNCGTCIKHIHFSHSTFIWRMDESCRSSTRNS